jgi:hypothetical protein
MPGRPPLRYLGADVTLRARLPDGRALISFACAGAPLPCSAEAWPHELRGIGWHLAEIKRAIDRLPLQGAAPPPLPAFSQAPAPRPACLLSAHYAAAASERED